MNEAFSGLDGQAVLTGTNVTCLESRPDADDHFVRHASPFKHSLALRCSQKSLKHLCETGLYLEWPSH